MFYGSGLECWGTLFRGQGCVSDLRCSVYLFFKVFIRNAPEKQLNIFKDLEANLPEYTFINCAEYDLKKQDYHQLLGQAKIVFSANLQETLGISCHEIFLAGGYPLVPDRLSYSEMYNEEFTYPSAWTESFEDYHNNKQALIDRIRYIMDNFNSNELRVAADDNTQFLNNQ